MTNDRGLPRQGGVALEVSMDAAKKIKMQLIAKGMTQRVLRDRVIKKLGMTYISEVYISRVINGKLKRGEVRRAICQVLGLALKDVGWN